MWYSFIQLSSFTAAWKSLKLTDNDPEALEAMLLKNPDAGDVLQGTGGLRKIRFAPPSKKTGKSGGTRVVYILLREGHAIYRFTIFGKSSKQNLTDKEKTLYKSTVESLRHFLGEREQA